MKSLLEKIENFLDESNHLNGDAYEYKAIFTEQGKKVNLARSSTMSFGVVNKEGVVQNLTWKEFKELNIKDKTSEYVQKEFIKSLASQLKNFGKQVELNRFVREKNPSFEEKVDWLLKNGAKYTKKGIKSV